MENLNNIYKSVNYIGQLPTTQHESILRCSKLDRWVDIRSGEMGGGGGWGGCWENPLFDLTIESEIFCYPKNMFETLF